MPPAGRHRDGRTAGPTGHAALRTIHGRDDGLTRLDHGLAANQGVSTDEAADGISKVLPDLVNELTPDGVVPDMDVIKERLGALASG